MKRIIFGLITVVAGMAGSAQNESDALLYSFNRPTGTARSISLGGAMGALGGDFSSLSINPAGIAVYRSSEFSFTPSLNYTNTKSTYYGLTSEDDKFSVPIQQIGFVGTYKPMYEASSGLISTHFSIGYTRTNSFSRNTFIQGNNVQSSLLDEFEYYAEYYTPSQLDDFYQGIAYDVELLELLPGISDVYYHGFNYLSQTGPNTYSINWGPLYGINQGKVISERGNSGEFSLAGGANFNNKLYLGASLGITNLFYDMKSQHYEEAAIGENGRYKDDYYTSRELAGKRILDNFSFNSKYTTTGVGVNLKVGVIYKPVNPLRVGLAIHTPNMYSIDLDFENDVKAKYINGPTILPEKIPTGEFSYNFSTPFKTIGSIAYIIGDKGFISLDYDRTDYSTMKFRSKGGSYSEKNNMEVLNKIISKTYQTTNNFRFGAEYRASETLSFRGGYATYQNPFKKKYLNSKGTRQTFSGGFGYKFNNMYIDLAYMLHQEKDIHSLYYSEGVEAQYQETADIENNNHQVAVTLGWRF